MKIIKKAFTVWHEGMLGFGPEIYNEIEEIPITYAKTPGEAKQNANHLDEYEINGEPHRFIDIKVRRAKMSDVLELEDGSQFTRRGLESQKNQDKKIAERTDKVNAYPDDTCFYVQNGYVGNSVLWWGLNSSGYTTDLNKAQIYTKQEVLDSFVDGREKDRIWEAKHVLENVKQHVDGQYLSSQHQC